MPLKPTILVVEDDKYWIEHHKVALKNSEVEILGVQTVYDALKMLRKTAFAAVIVDLEIPGTKNNALGGFEVLESARKSNPYSELLVITAHAESEVVERVSRFNIPFLIKPVDHRELAISVASAISSWDRRFVSLSHLFETFLDDYSILAQRGHKRPPFVLSNEYDVQDLMHTILKSFYPDVVAEEYTLKRAGKTKRLDLVIRGLEAVIETKMIRDKSHASHISDELDIDIRGYVSHPHCRRLFCYVYDPKHLIKEPRQIERDLAGESSQDGATIDASVLIRPQL
jgi:DNA-binding response OmpR family regulator